MSDVQLTISAQQPPKPSPARLVLTLGLAGTLSGLVLSTVFQITDPIIRRNNQRALEAAVYTVVPDSARMQKLVLLDDRLQPATPEQAQQRGIYAAYAGDGTFLGYAIEHQGPGFQDDINLLYGYDPATRRVIGMRVLKSLETPGLGDKIIKDHAFVAQFDDLAVEPLVTVVKDGRDEPFEIDAITGATVSSKAVVTIINAANELWLDKLPDRPPPPPEPEPEPLPDAPAAQEGGAP